jgi:hypothetical protein
LAILHVAWGLGFKKGLVDSLPQKPDGALLFKAGPGLCLGAGRFWASEASTVVLLGSQSDVWPHTRGPVQSVPPPQPKVA